jgi:hypothetical protein
MATLFELCSLIRSKNAGPFILTFDLMFSSRENYERAKKGCPLTKAVLSEMYGQAERDITLVYHDHALAIKASMPRPIFQGELHDGDCYGGQQYVPLLHLPVD